MLRSLRAEVADTLSAALDSLDWPADDLGLEDPPADVDAVLASSVAFRLAGEAGAAPPAVAEQVADAIDPAELTYVDRVVPAGPYLNFEPGPAYYAETLRAARAEGWGRLEPTGESVLIEHTSFNPTGPVHVGRARNTVLGDALARLLEAAGHDVERHYYVNDAGRQMAIFTWAYETFEEADLPDPARDRAEYDLVRYYRAGNEFLETADEADREAAEAEIRAIMQGLEERDDATYERVSEVVDGVLGGIRQCLERLPARFDAFVKETRFMRDGSTEAVIDRLKDSEYALYEDDAWQLDLTAWGVDKQFVFLRSDGTSLYTTRDLAHHEWKFERADRAITVLGEDQALHASQLEAALEILGNDVDRLESLFYGWVNLPGGESMSTREGTGVDLDDLLDEAVDRARAEVESRMDDRIREDDLDADDVERIARQVGIGAVRYDIVAKQPQKSITFEFERALDFEAQSAPYVQYVHARACGILERADATPGEGDPTTSGEGDPTTPDEIDPAALEAPEAQELLEVIARYPALLEDAAADREPHQVATYTREFAESFNAFYRECPVLADDVDPAVREARLALVAAARNTVAAALDTLGVEAPDSM